MLLRRILVGASAAVLLGTLIPVTNATAGRGCWSYKGGERKFAEKMNAARRKSGRRAFQLDPELSKVARKHTRAMTGNNLLFHSTSVQLRNRVTNWTWLGENVGVGGGVRSLHKAFMRSPAHKSNILERQSRHIGVGTRRAHGRLWVTVIFQSKADPGTTLQMPSC
ncbi:MAG: CAP domain-containing protein [Actinomycetota bacterium]